MKKYLYLALAMPMMFACSSDDLLEKGAVSNDQFSGIEKVDATFTMDEGSTRFDGGTTGVAEWKAQEGDLWGFAWMGDGTNVGINGKAFQNHNLIQKSNYFEPQTSIYVGSYFIYRPYDKTTVSPQAINFKSLESQALAEGYESEKQPWRDLAKTAINIGDCWTNVTKTGWTDLAGTTWDKAGIKQYYKLYPALFSNQTGLDLTYVKNNPKFAAAATITGATDINYPIAAGTEVGSADIYEVTVDLDGAANSFTYAPTASPNGTSHSGTFWADKSGASTYKVDNTNGFSFNDDVITLIPADATNGLSTGTDGSKAWFWFNSLPVTAGNGALATDVETVFTTSYGVVTVDETVGSSAYVYDDPTGAGNLKDNGEWMKLVDTGDDLTADPKEWDITNNTFINQYGNHKGKYALTVDFSTGKMNNMHIKNDAHLQKLLKYYIASGKTETVSLNLDEDANNEFKISKLSIALLQTIGGNVKVHACGTHGTPKIIVTQEGQTGDLATATEVPELNNVFDAATDVYLASGTNWTWKERTTGPNKLTVDAKVKSLTNEGTLTVNATNVQLTTSAPLANAAGATMNITQVTTVKNALTNLGTINVPAGAELRAYGVEIKNDATSLTASGTINNAGAVGVTAGTSGKFNNYGVINMTSNGAITLLSSNELNANTAPDGPFKTAFVAATNMMGTVVLPTGNPTAIVSVANADETGFIKYNWTGATYAHDSRNVKYNTLVVTSNIEFTRDALYNQATEIQFIEFNGTGIQVVNPVNPDIAADKGWLPNLRGVIVNAGKSIIIEKTNGLRCSDGAYLGSGAAVYRGGVFDYQSTTNYLGTWSTDQILEY
jgi:hypothetical protein